MKKMVILLLAAIVFGCLPPYGAGDVSAAETASQKNAKQDRILLPENIYAVPGIECNIYFRNIFLAINPDNYVFDVTCEFGRNDRKRWRFTPEPEHGGKSFPLTISVYGEDGKIAESRTTVHVAPADAGKGREITILMVGDSLTNYTVYPARLYELCQGENNPKLTMIGTRRFVPKGIRIPEDVRHEGWAGWRWDSFLTRWDEDPAIKKPRKSRFLFKREGKLVFSLADYLKTNKFKTPDIITIQLGVNDIFHAVDEDRAERIRMILENADKMIACFRKDAPDALIGVGFVTPGALQDGFGYKSRCTQTAWGYFLNTFFLNRAMAKHFAGKDPKLFLIPGNVGLDTENNFPVRKEEVNYGNPAAAIRQFNGVHPAPAGYRQIGDIYYAWLKNMLTEKNGR